MVSPSMGAAMMGTVYAVRANCAQHGGGASGGLIRASLPTSYRTLASRGYHHSSRGASLT